MMLGTSTTALADEPASTTTLTSDSVAAKPQRVRHNPTLFATGLVLAITGGVGVGVGGGLYIAGSNSSCFNAPFCDPKEQAKKPDDEALVNGGIAIMIMSAVMIAVGVPMAIIGGKKDVVQSALNESPLAFRF